MEITISGKDKERLQQVEELAKSLGLKISKKQVLQEKKKKKAIDALEKLAKMGAFKDIDDPVAWQKEQRKDRNIGRDE
ncbi:hypothetical protein LB467_03545 [Salegentibacter sp. JZCK2]|uniref:hypothetical protein n=1 Tax=Salegentibacter tibetensis TaxID=2873600 RepID=UPI001CCA8481|nr:hypothetical protein [Salegentibacter tibetensis]MBZ9728749.1 hypothetical protein [Salegentibacter tibetensis]